MLQFIFGGVRPSSSFTRLAAFSSSALACQVKGGCELAPVQFSCKCKGNNKPGTSAYRELSYALESCPPALAVQKASHRGGEREYLL